MAADVSLRVPKEPVDHYHDEIDDFDTIFYFQTHQLLDYFLPS